MAATKSATRVTSVLSISLILSWAPESTSCSRMLGSRSRSNRAVASERRAHLGDRGAPRLLGGCARRKRVLLQFAQRARDGRGRALGGGFRGILQLAQRAVDGGGGALGRDLRAGVHLLDRAADRAGRGV